MKRGFFKVSIRPSQTPYKKTISYLRGKETLVISTCFVWLSFYVCAKTGASEVLRRCLQHQGIQTIFKFDTTLRSHLVRPKDALEPTKQNGVVHKIPCECGKGYIGETGRSMRERIKEHDGYTRFARTQTSAASERANRAYSYLEQG